MQLSAHGRDEYSAVSWMLSGIWQGDLSTSKEHWMKMSGKWFCAFLWWYCEVAFTHWLQDSGGDVYVVWIPPPSRKPWNTYLWKDSNHRSGVYIIPSDERVRGTKGSDLAEWEKNNWNQLMQSAGLQLQIKRQFPKSWLVFVQSVVQWKERWYLVENNSFVYFCYDWEEKDRFVTLYKWSV